VMKFKADALIGFILCHSLAALAFFPSFFSWTGVVLLVFGMLAFGVLGTNLGFHRLITHRGLAVPLWLEHTFAVLGTFSLQFSHLWVAVHRRHHHHADNEQDPHSPLRGFFWAHFGWLLLMRSGDMRSRWSVNPVTHIWGYRNYATPDDSRNNPLIGLITAGEGRHDNHHADPTSARPGHLWWEFDFAWQAIRFLMWLGFATNKGLAPVSLPRG
jgi:fatty-acid desaturase